MLFYCTADEIGTETGGGAVTHHESEAFRTLGGLCQLLQRKHLDWGGNEPWKWDLSAYQQLCSKVYSLGHFYSGTFGKTVRELKSRGARVAYTIAAHDKEVSEREHARLGFPFPYLHLTDNLLWQKYITGYREADVLICPGSVPANTIRGYGPEFENKRIAIIPHGCNLPEEVKPAPQEFIVGYAGAVGPDKGLIYLLEAWAKLRYTDARLVLAGRETVTDVMRYLINRSGAAGNISVLGWVKNLSDFYNSISLYIQPSATEGFGLEVLEAMAHHRPVLCSDAAGAVDLVGEPYCFKACNVEDLCDHIKFCREKADLTVVGKQNRKVAEDHTWDKVKDRYIKVWKECLA